MTATGVEAQILLSLEKLLDFYPQESLSNLWTRNPISFGGVQRACIMSILSLLPGNLVKNLQNELSYDDDMPLLELFKSVFPGPIDVVAKTSGPCAACISDQRDGCTYNGEFRPNVKPLPISQPLQDGLNKCDFCKTGPPHPRCDILEMKDSGRRCNRCTSVARKCIFRGVEYSDYRNAREQLAVVAS